MTVWSGKKSAKVRIKKSQFLSVDEKKKGFLSVAEKTQQNSIAKKVKFFQVVYFSKLSAVVKRHNVLYIGYTLANLSIRRVILSS